MNNLSRTRLVVTLGLCLSTAPSAAQQGGLQSADLHALKSFAVAE